MLSLQRKVLKCLADQYEQYCIDEIFVRAKLQTVIFINSSGESDRAEFNAISNSTTV